MVHGSELDVCRWLSTRRDRQRGRHPNNDAQPLFVRTRHGGHGTTKQGLLSLVSRQGREAWTTGCQPLRMWHGGQLRSSRSGLGICQSLQAHLGKRCGRKAKRCCPTLTVKTRYGCRGNGGRRLTMLLPEDEGVDIGTGSAGEKLQQLREA